MNKLFKVLPLFALMLGIGVAIAGSLPSINTKQAFKNNQWVDITGKILNQDYACDPAPTHDCTRELNAQGQVVSLVKGNYREI